jgi:hypothetical protein
MPFELPEVNVECGAPIGEARVERNFEVERKVVEADG